MSAPTTQIYRSLIDQIRVGDRCVRFDITDEQAAQLIAGSEARACDQLRAENTLLRAAHKISTDTDEQMIKEVLASRAARDECERQFQDKVQRLGEEVEVTNQLRAEVERLTAQRENLLKPMRDQATARAERAEAELANIRALANRRNKQDHSHDTTHQLVASLDQSLDIVQAELVEERWLKGCAIKRSQELLAELAAERARLDWLASPQGRLWQRQNESALVCRASIDAAMQEAK